MADTVISTTMSAQRLGAVIAAVIMGMQDHPQLPTFLKIHLQRFDAISFFCFTCHAIYFLDFLEIVFGRGGQAFGHGRIL